jgi:hypothetical protein
MRSTGWENLSDEGGAFGLVPIDRPGDAIMFFREPKATTPDGNPVFSVDITVDAIKRWLATDTAITVGPMTDVTVGGLSGVKTEIAVAAGVDSHPGDCPVKTCVSIFKGVDPAAVKTWQWDWGTASSEAQRLYLLATTDGVVAIFVDSLDGTTFPALSATADKILATIKFDKP